MDNITTTDQNIIITTTDEVININAPDEIININATEEIINIVTQTGAYPLPSTVYSVFGRIGNVVGEEGDYTLIKLGDVTITNPKNGQILVFNGTEWINDDSNSVPYTGAISNVNLGAYSITANAIIKNGGVDTQFLKADGSIDNNTYLTANDLPSTLSLYATNVPAAVSGYYKLVTTIDDTDFNTIAVDIPTGTISTTTQLIASLISPSNLISGNPGVFNVTTIGNIKKVSGSGEAEFYFEIYKRTSTGIETKVGTSAPTLPVVNSGYAEFSAMALWNDGTFDVNDTIVLKFYGSRIAGGSNPTYSFQFGGVSPVRTIVPIPTAVIPNIYLNELADVEDAAPTDNDGIFWDSTAVLWKNKTIAEVLGYTPVPYEGATGQVNLGAYDLIVNELTIGKGNNSVYGNTAIGENALVINVYGGQNTAIGYYSLSSNTNGVRNTAIGYNALAFNTYGGGNTAIGHNALINNEGGSFNTAIGRSSFRQLVNGGWNTALGHGAGTNVISGLYNVIIGGNAGNEDMNNNIILSDGQGNIRYQFDGVINNFNDGVIINSTTQGFITARMTNTEKNAIPTPATATEVYDTTKNRKSIYNGSFWDDGFRWFDYVVGKTAVTETTVTGGVVQELSYSGTTEKRYRFIGNPYDSATDIIYKTYSGGVLSLPLAYKLITL